MAEDGFELEADELENIGGTPEEAKPEELGPEKLEAEAEPETTGDDKTGDDKDQRIADLEELNDKQLGKIIGTKHAEKEWQAERKALNDRIATLETANTTVEVSPIDKWLSEQKAEDRAELTEADIPLVVTRAENAFQAKQATAKTNATESQPGAVTEQQVNDRLNEVAQDEVASGLYDMASAYLTDGERKSLIWQLMKAKDGPDAARITKQVSFAIINKRGSEFQKEAIKSIRTKSSKEKPTPKKGDESENDDALKDLDFTGLSNTGNFMEFVK